MANDFGKPTSAILSSEFKPRLLKDGSWEATDSFVCPWSTVQSLLPSIGGPNPRPGWNFLIAQELEIEPNRGDLCKVIVQYSAKSTGEGDFDFDSADDDDFTYNLSITNTSEDIETHYRYKDLTLQDKEIAGYIRLGSYKRVDTVPPAAPSYTFINQTDPTKTYTFTTDGGKELVNLITKGILQYENPVQVWSASWTANERPQDYLFERVGTITDPPGNPPTPPTRNWLMTGLDMEQNGKTYKITARYAMSGRGGWAKELYEDPTPPFNVNAPTILTS